MNCKPGDMARVVKSRFPSNVGLIVEVLTSEIDSEGKPGWKTKPAWPCFGILDGVLSFSSDVTWFDDDQLRPIRPPETPVTETRDEELAA